MHPDDDDDRHYYDDEYPEYDDMEFVDNHKALSYIAVILVTFILGLSFVGAMWGLIGFINWLLT